MSTQGLLIYEKHYYCRYTFYCDSW